MQLNFCWKGKLPSQYVPLFNATAKNISPQFMEWFTAVSESQGRSLDWWVCNPSTRSPIMSPLFHYCCFLAFLQELMERNEPIVAVRTDSKAFHKILSHFIRVNSWPVRVVYEPPSLLQRLRSTLIQWYQRWVVPRDRLHRWWLAQRSVSQKKAIPFKPLTLIYTYYFRDAAESHNFPGLLDTLSDEEQATLYFVPKFYGIYPREFRKIFEQIRQSSKNYLLPEDYLRLSDYWYAWSHLWRIRRLRWKSIPFLGVDLVPLIQEEIESDRSLESAVDALLIYRFVQRLRESDLPVKRVMNWFQNQVMDRGWSAGFHQHFSQATSVGYQAFVGMFWQFNLYPMQLEKRHRLVPNEVAVTGNALVTPTQQFCSGLKVSVVPAFRFQGVWRERKPIEKPHPYTILIALTSMLGPRNEVLSVVHGCLQTGLHLPQTSPNPQGVRFAVKLHPINTPEQVRREFPGTWPDALEFVTGNFQDCLDQADVLVSSGSSVSMEALAQGVPSVVVGSQSGLSYIPIPDEVDEGLWRLCYTPKELSAALEYFQSRDPATLQNHRKLGDAVREGYFAKLTSHGVRQLLNLE